MKKLLLASLLVSASAHATYFSGNDILNKLTSEGSDRALALGYVAGIHDALENVAVCSPNGVTLGQLRDIVIRKLRSVPEKRHMAADLFIFQALTEAFPCKNKKNT